MEFDAHEDATFRYTNIETVNNATGLYPRWEYNTLLNAYFEIIPVIKANALDSNSAYNSWASEGEMINNALPKENATLFRFYNKATNTSTVLTDHIPLKGYSLLDKGKIAWYGVRFQASAQSDTTFKATDNTGGGVFHLPIAENQ